MSASALLFWAIALWTVTMGFFTVASRNVIRAAVSLAGTCLGVAALYFFMGADFLGAAQILIYVGGIVVLFLFAVMFTHMKTAAPRDGEEDERRTRRAESAWTNRILGGLAAIGAFILATTLLGHLPPGRVALEETVGAEETAVETVGETAGETAGPLLSGGEGTTAQIGEALLGKYLLPFEIISVVLLVVLIGAVLLVRKEIREPDAEEGEAQVGSLSPGERERVRGKLPQRPAPPHPGPRPQGRGECREVRRDGIRPHPAAGRPEFRRGRRDAGELPGRGGDPLRARDLRRRDAAQRSHDTDGRRADPQRGGDQLRRLHALRRGRRGDRRAGLHALHNCPGRGRGGRRARARPGGLPDARDDRPRPDDGHEARGRRGEARWTRRCRFYS